MGTGDATAGGAEPRRDEPVLATEDRDGAVLVRLGGELDLYNAPILRAELARAAARATDRLVVDLSQVTFLDSTALGVLVEARTKLANRRAFLLAAPGLETRRTLQVSGVERHLGIHASVDDALAAAL
jgi:anti-sigma B factor antagonist